MKDLGGRWCRWSILYTSTTMTQWIPPDQRDPLGHGSRSVENRPAAPPSSKILHDVQVISPCHGKDRAGPESSPTKAASSAKLDGSWMVVTVGVWLGTQLHPFAARVWETKA